LPFIHGGCLTASAGSGAAPQEGESLARNLSACATKYDKLPTITAEVPEKEIVPDLPIWKNPELMGMLRESLKYILITLVAFLTWSKMLKPLYERIMYDLAALKEEREKPPPTGEEEAPVVQKKQLNRKQRAFDAKLESARDLAQSDPRVVADVIKSWAGANE